MDHPMHLHGTYFLLVSVNGMRPERETWKDTVNVPAGRYVDVAFVMKNRGEWMLHCHIIDHEDGGMMTFVRAE
jgi:FtsP/CotA-like multicopper oxidase with cupredoxin domain